MSNKYVDAIGRDYPGVGVDARGDNYEDIDWHNETPISKAELEVKIATFNSLPPKPNSSVELYAAIRAATTLQQLKDALLGEAGKQGRVLASEL